MGSASSRLRRSSVALIGSAAAGAGFFLAPTFALRATNTTAFCVSCHSMQFPLADAAEASHSKNDHGATVGCADCHVPRALAPYLRAKILAARDVYRELADPVLTRADYERVRPEWAARTRAKFLADDSAACRHCHQFESFSSPIKAHERALAQGTTCIVCHYNLVHGETPWPEMEREL